MHSEVYIVWEYVMCSICSTTAELFLMQLRIHMSRRQSVCEKIFFPFQSHQRKGLTIRCIFNIWRLLENSRCAHNLFLCRFCLINRNACVIVYDVNERGELKFKRNHPHNPCDTKTNIHTIKCNSIVEQNENDG